MNDVGFDVPMQFSTVIEKRLLLGSRPRTADDLKALRYGYLARGIIDVCEEDDAALLGEMTWLDLGISYHFLPTPDDGYDKPAEWWTQGIGFIASAIQNRRCVAVHCVNGIERSVSLVYGYLRTQGFSARQAELIIVTARPIDLIGMRYRDNFEKLFAAGQLGSN